MNAVCYCLGGNSDSPLTGASPIVITSRSGSLGISSCAPPSIKACIDDTPSGGSWEKSRGVGSMAPKLLYILIFISAFISTVPAPKHFALSRLHVTKTIEHQPRGIWDDLGAGSQLAPLGPKIPSKSPANAIFSDDITPQSTMLYFCPANGRRASTSSSLFFLSMCERGPWRRTLSSTSFNLEDAGVNSFAEFCSFSF